MEQCSQYLNGRLLSPEKESESASSIDTILPQLLGEFFKAY